MNSEHILVVEDEEDILELVRFHLQKAGYKVTAVDSGDRALKMFGQVNPDLVLLDLMLPGVGGLEICKTIRQSIGDTTTPVIMLTAKGEESDIIKGLQAGADDYIPKPFSPKVLIARIQAALRRREANQPGADEILRVGGLAINPGRHEVIAGKETISLTKTEFQVLHFLARRPGWVFTRYQIVDGVKGEDYVVTDRAVDVTIVGLRRKLGRNAHLIETVRGVGYRFQDA